MTASRPRASPAPALRWGKPRGRRRRSRLMAMYCRVTLMPENCRTSCNSRARLSDGIRRSPKGCNISDGGNWMVRVARLALAGLLVIAASGVTRAEDFVKAKVGVLRLSSSAPVFIAQDKGYFHEAGLDIDLNFFHPPQPTPLPTTSAATHSP